LQSDKKSVESMLLPNDHIHRMVAKGKKTVKQTGCMTPHRARDATRPDNSEWGTQEKTSPGTGVKYV